MDIKRIATLPGCIFANRECCYYIHVTRSTDLKVGAPAALKAGKQALFTGAGRRRWTAALKYLAYLHPQCPHPLPPAAPSCPWVAKPLCPCAPPLPLPCHSWEKAQPLQQGWPQQQLPWPRWPPHLWRARRRHCPHPLRCRLPLSPPAAPPPWQPKHLPHCAARPPGGLCGCRWLRGGGRGAPRPR